MNLGKKDLIYQICPATYRVNERASHKIKSIPIMISPNLYQEQDVCGSVADVHVSLAYGMNEMWYTMAIDD
jgi:hypothetical protein